uniref:Uncharacterized protein n=1 Tax=Anguilla anguilla TaxID=7936 RepID=A0A0E9WTA1_ANGAN
MRSEQEVWLPGHFCKNTSARCYMFTVPKRHTGWAVQYWVCIQQEPVRKEGIDPFNSVLKDQAITNK